MCVFQQFCVRFPFGSPLEIDKFYFSSSERNEKKNTLNLCYLFVHLRAPKRFVIGRWCVRRLVRMPAMPERQDDDGGVRFTCRLL